MEIIFEYKGICWNSQEVAKKIFSEHDTKEKAMEIVRQLYMPIDGINKGLEEVKKILNELYK